MAALPVESSWRMVEGEHDSFDTSIVPDAFGVSGEYGNDDGDDPFISSSGAPSQQSATGSATSAGAAASVARSSARLGLGTRTVSSASRGGVSSSQEDRVSLGGDSFGGSVGGSQDDDIHSFLRKAENDERVLLRSPFQPSLPSSVRQSPLSVSSTSKTANNNSKSTGGGGSSNGRDRRSFQTPEPEFHMPTIDMDGSIHADGGHPLGASLGQRVAGVSSSFRVSDTGSPAQRRRTGGSLLGRLNGSAGRGRAKDDAGSSEKGAPLSAAAAWRRAVLSSRASLLLLLPLLGLIAAYGTPLFAAGFYATTVGTVCSIPGARNLGLPFCPPTTTTNTNSKPSLSSVDGEDAIDAAQEGNNYWAIRNRFNHETRQAASEEQMPSAPVISLVRSASELMRVQTQLADVVRERVLAGRSSGSGSNTKVPPAQDAWLVPRAQTKDLRLAAQIYQSQSGKNRQKQQKPHQHTATLLLVELDAYLDAAKRVSIALTRLQTGAAATAADTLAYRSRQTLAQLRRMAAAVSRAQEYAGGSSGDGDSDSNSDKTSGGWLARLFSSTTGASSSYTSASLRREVLLDAYRHHTDAMLAKTQLRVDEAEAVLKALEGATGHLTGIQSYVTARRDELVGVAKANAQDEEAAGGSSTGGGPSLDAAGGLLSWLWAFLFGQSHDTASLSSPAQPRSAAKMSKAARAWSGYADQLRRLREEHDAAVGRAVEALDELAAVRDALKVLQSQFGSGDSDSNTIVADEGDLDLRLHMDIVDAGIQDLQKAGR